MSIAEDLPYIRDILQEIKEDIATPRPTVGRTQDLVVAQRAWDKNQIQGRRLYAVLSDLVDFVSDKDGDGYIPQSTSAACIKSLREAGMGKQGTSNTLADMVEELVSEAGARKYENDALRRWVSDLLSGIHLLQRVAHAVVALESDDFEVRPPLRRGPELDELNEAMKALWEANVVDGFMDTQVEEKVL